MAIEVLERDYVDGVQLSLIKDNDEIKFQRKEGRYKYQESWGKMNEEAAIAKFNSMKG